MRFGTMWRSAVLASVTLLVSGQLCMLTTCVPRLRVPHASAHACCRATPGPAAPAAPAHERAGAMPCDIMLHGTAAPVLASASPAALPVALVLAATAALAPPTRLAALPFVGAESGPPHERTTPAPAGPRAPPQG